MAKGPTLVPVFSWQPLKPEPVYHDPAIRDYHMNWAVPAYQRMRTPSGYAAEILHRLRTLANFFLGPVLLISKTAGPDGTAEIADVKRCPS